MIMAGRTKWADIRGEVSAEQRERIDTLKAGARADSVAFSLAELRKARELTQVELAERLKTAQPTVSAMENAGDNLVSTVRSVVESLGGHLEMVAVFGDERIALDTSNS